MRYGNRDYEGEGRGGEEEGGATEGSTDLGPVDWIEGDELIDVGVGPLEEGLDVEWIYKGAGLDLWSSWEQISGRRECDNLGAPLAIA